MNYKTRILLSSILFFSLLYSINVSAGVIDKAIKFSVSAIDEVIEIANKLSGKKVLSSASKRKLTQQLTKEVALHGDDALRATKMGGIELVEAATKYGDDVYKFAKKVPGATRTLALHADELVPLTRRLGTNVLTIEAKAPGLTKHIISNFGDDAVKVFAKKIDPKNMTKLVGYAERCTSKEAKKLLLKECIKTDGKILKHLNWKHIMSGGLSVAMITSAYKVSDGVETGLKDIAKNHPEQFSDTIISMLKTVTWPFLIPLGVLFTLFVSWKIIYYYNRRKKTI